MAVEQAVNGACANNGRASGVLGAGLLPANHCGPCIDVPLWGDPMIRVVLTPAGQVPDGAAFAPTAIHSHDLPIGGFGPWRGSLCRFPLPADCVSSVVLRI